MAIIKEITYDGSFLEDGQIQVREITRLMEDGVELSKQYHRHVVDVGDDVSGEDQMIQDIAAGLHTPARIAARAIARAAQLADMP
jgi:hypothetical protein